MYERYRIHTQWVGWELQKSVVSTRLTGLACCNSRSYCQKRFWTALGVIYSPGKWFPWVHRKANSCEPILRWVMTGRDTYLSKVDRGWKTMWCCLPGECCFPWMGVSRQIPIYVQQFTGFGDSPANSVVHVMSGKLSVCFRFYVSVAIEVYCEKWWRPISD